MCIRDRLSTQFDVIVDFTVEDDRDRTISAVHRLSSAHDVDNGKAAMPKADLVAAGRSIGRQVPRAVRATMRHQVSKVG